MLCTLMLVILRKACLYLPACFLALQQAPVAVVLQTVWALASVPGGSGHLLVVWCCTGTDDYNGMTRLVLQPPVEAEKPLLLFCRLASLYMDLAVPESY